VTCYYDGACGLCRGSVRFLGRLDWLDRLRFEDLTALRDEDLPVPRESAMRGMPATTADGRALVGLDAVRAAMLQTPAGFIPAMVLYVPGIAHLARAVYNRVARSRARDACAAPVSVADPPD